MFHIPAASSITTLFVIKTDFYTKKDTGEIVANIQALSPIPEGAGNGKGFEVTEYRADASILEHVDVTEKPSLYKFESQIRPVTDRFGRTTNTQVLTNVLQDAQRPVERPNPQQQQNQPKPENKG